MNLKEFFRLPIVMFMVHVFLLLGIFVNVYQLYRLDDIQREVDKKAFNLDTLRQQNEDSRNNKDYYNSDLFKEKFAKEEDFKKRGEIVIDTSLIEGEVNNPDSNYIPEEKIVEKSNPLMWWELIFNRER